MANFKNYLRDVCQVASIFFCVACSTVPTSESLTEAKYVDVELSAYEQGVIDAKNVENWEISQNLSKITVDNPSLKWKLMDGDKHILVSSWKAETEYYEPQEGSKYYDTGEHFIWVTLVPELKKMCSDDGFGRTVGVETRLKQKLGLTPDSNYKAFVEFWVKPRDLFRPCPDSEITDGKCDLTFPPKVKASHRAWIENERKTNTYPWTQLGYTYDWNVNSGNHLGLSEFVIEKNAKVVVAGIYETRKYCSSNL